MQSISCKNIKINIIVYDALFFNQSKYEYKAIKW